MSRRHDWSHCFVVEEGNDVTIPLSDRRLDSTRRPGIGHGLSVVIPGSVADVADGPLTRAANWANRPPSASENILKTSVRKSGLPNIIEFFVGRGTAPSDLYDSLGHASTERVTRKPACPRWELPMKCRTQSAKLGLPPDRKVTGTFSNRPDSLHSLPIHFGHRRRFQATTLQTKCAAHTGA